LSKSSFEEYIGKLNSNFSEKTIILEQFRSKKEYKKFALSSWKETLINKDKIKELEFE